MTDSIKSRHAMGRETHARTVKRRSLVAWRKQAWSKLEYLEVGSELGGEQGSCKRFSLLGRLDNQVISNRDPHTRFDFQDLMLIVREEGRKL